MKKSGVFVKALVISGLMVINGQSAVLSDSKPTSDICGNLVLYEDSVNESSNSVLDCTPGTWTGTTGSDWNTAANWCDGQVPTSLTDVVIPSVSNYPIINSDAICKNITIRSGAKLSILDSNILTVKGDWVNYGTFFKNESTVIFSGNNQKVGKGPYFNMTLRGNGLKTIFSISEVFYYGTLSMEETASVSEKPYPDQMSYLQYDTPIARTVGPEWSSLYTSGGIRIKNTGIITLNGSKTLTNISNKITYRSGLTIDEGATLNLHTFTIEDPEEINLKCGGLTQGSSIIGTGTLTTLLTHVNVTDAGHGTAGAQITCPLKLTGTIVFNVANDDPNNFTNNDLTINMISNGGYFSKSGNGTLNMGTTIMTIGDLIINEGNVTIPVGAQVKAYNKITVTPNNGLTIESDINGSGSLIAFSSMGNGNAIVECFMTPGAWHIVAPPVSEQLISEFLGSNGSIPTDEYSNRGMRDYNPGLNLWNDFFNNKTTGVLTEGKGYCMRVRTSQEHKVKFKGILKAGEVVISGLTAGKWNCIGNPYTSAMKINSLSTGYTFLGVNSANLDPSYGAIYIWDQLDENNGMADKYTIISNAVPSYDIQLGQAFMVKMKDVPTANSVNFTTIMQSHLPGLALKSTDEVWPTIKLSATAQSVTSSTIIAFHEGMTPGLDPTYDAGLLKGGASVEVYTQLLEDNGISFDIQALPADYQSTVVPVGLDCTKGQQVSFSAELMHIPSACKAILEDRLTNTFTDLSLNSYTADLMGSTVSLGRFFLHTSYTTTGIDSRDRIQNLRAWMVSGQEMKISGEVSSKAMARLYDVQGCLVLSESLKAGFNHTVRLPDLKPGMYILKVEEMQYKQTLKLFVNN